MFAIDIFVRKLVAAANKAGVGNNAPAAKVLKFMARTILIHWMTAYYVWIQCVTARKKCVGQQLTVHHIHHIDPVVR